MSRLDDIRARVQAAGSWTSSDDLAYLLGEVERLSDCTDRALAAERERAERAEAAVRTAHCDRLWDEIAPALQARLRAAEAERDQAEWERDYWSAEYDDACARYDEFRAERDHQAACTDRALNRALELGDALVDAQAERDALAATVARVEALAEEDRTTWIPGTFDTPSGEYVDAKELRAALKGDA